MNKKVTVIYKDGEVEIYVCKRIERSKGFLVICLESNSEDGCIYISESLIRKVVQE